LTIALRPASVHDARTLGHLSVAAWRQAYRGLVPEALLDSLSTEERTEGFEEFLAAAGQTGRRGWLAHIAHAPVGFVLCGPARDLPDRSSSGEIFALYVLRAYWGTGAAQELIRQAMLHLEAFGCPQVVLWVLEANARARRFYEREGFSPDGFRKVDSLAGQALDEIRYCHRFAAALSSQGG